MENHIILFLAILWACFAANDSTPNIGHRNLAPGNMKDVCVDLHGYGCGKYDLGHHTLHVAKWKQRWFHKYPEVTLGYCKNEDALPPCASDKEVAYCRWFGSQQNGMYCTMYVPKFFGPWLESVGAYKGECTSRIQGDMIEVEYRGSGGGSPPGTVVDTEVMCMDVRGSHQTLEVRAIRDALWWLEDEDDYIDSGECDFDDNHETNDDLVYSCVKLPIYDDDKYNWFLFDHDDSLTNWLRDISDSFRSKHCDDADIWYDQLNVIEMYHHDDGGSNEPNDITKLLCMGDNTDWHTLEVTADRDVIDWLRDDYAYQQKEGKCDPPDDYDETNSDPVYYCVDLDIYNNGQDETYLVDTDSSLLGLWKEVSVTFRNKHCKYIGNNGISYGDRFITMIHHEEEDDDDVLCIEFDFDDVVNESHTVKVEVTPSSKKDDVLDWFKDLNGNNWFVDDGNCSPDYKHESNQGSTRRCVRLDGDGISGWWDIESYEWFDGFLQAESKQIKWNSCSSINRSSEGTIKLSHK